MLRSVVALAALVTSGLAAPTAAPADGLSPDFEHLADAAVAALPAQGTLKIALRAGAAGADMAAGSRCAALSNALERRMRGHLAAALGDGSQRMSETAADQLGRRDLAIDLAWSHGLGSLEVLGTLRLGSGGPVTARSFATMPLARLSQPERACLGPAESTEPAEPVTETMSSAVATVPLLVAAAPLAYGVRLVPEMVTEKPWPADARPEGTFMDISELFGAADGTADAEIQGPVVIRSMAQGEPVLASKISRPPDTTPGPAARQAVAPFAITLDPDSPVPAFLAAGDRVDILLLSRTRAGETEANVIVADRAVIAVESDAEAGGIITVAVTEAEAQKIALANTIGRVDLTLRGLEHSRPRDGDTGETIGDTATE